VPRPTYRSELVGVSRVWLLVVEYASREVLFSSSPISVTDADGVVRNFPGGLPEVEVSRSASAFSSEPALLSVSLDLVFPMDVAALEARGHDLGAARGELSLIIDGNTWENRERVLVGAVVQPEVDQYDDPGGVGSGSIVKLSLEENPFDDRAQTHPDGARVSLSTWSEATGAVGEWYPLVYGTPGKYIRSDGTAGNTSGTPAYPVEYTGSAVDTVLIAGHPVLATTVMIRSEEGNVSGLSVVETTDAKGRTVATVDVSGQSADFRGQSEFYASWNGNGGGGLANLWGDGELEGAGDVIMWLLSLSSLPMDYGRCLSAAALLNRFRLAGVIDDATSPWDYLQDFILPLLPCSVLSGPDGLWLVFWRLDATSEHVVAEITDGTNAHRVSPVMREKHIRDVVGSWTVEYAYSDQTGRPRRVLAMQAEHDGDDVTQTTSRWSVVSKSRYGIEGRGKVSAEVVYDDATAQLIADWKARSEGFVHKTVTYRCSPELAFLEPGMVVSATSTEQHWTSQIALVRDVTLVSTRDDVDVTLWIVEDVARDIHEGA
jgi:hypothetical protein